ncbi:MAG: serine hydrolase [Caldilineaceae bacterium]|nr:serine hydrolase [Caldilineaceae bacterium]
MLQKLSGLLKQLLKPARIAKLVGAVVGLLLIVLVIWMAIAGPVTVYRILRYGDTDIDDFSHYPGRRLQATTSPFRFELDVNALQVPASVLRDFGADGQLEEILRSNDSIAFLVIKNDTILYERYFQGHTAAARSQSFSMAKSYTSALIGMAIDDGYLEGVDQRVTQYVPELADRGFGEVTIEHLLTMMSGSNYVEDDNPFAEHVILNYTPALEQEILKIAMETEPGTRFRYKSGDNALLALVLDRALGEETITGYTQRRFWNPLGMEQDGVWTIDHEGDGLEKTWCCLAASARDFAKLGRLYLRQGEWNGQQLLSPDWIQRSTQAGAVPEEEWPDDFRVAGFHNYGYQWWLGSREESDYLALGKDGQFLYVNPLRDVVIVRLGWSSGALRAGQWLSLFQTLAREAG